MTAVIRQSQWGNNDGGDSGGGIAIERVSVILRQWCWKHGNRYDGGGAAIETVLVIQ